jgi:phage shock protein E
MIIIDTRSNAEFQTGHVSGAINIPPEQFMAGLPAALNGVPKDEQVIVYCLSGSRSNVVGHILARQGFTNITNGINKERVEKLLSS